jgi:hypothetical protein
METRQPSAGSLGREDSGAADAQLRKGRTVEQIDRLLRHGQAWRPSDAPSGRLRAYEHDLLVGVRKGALRLRDAEWIKARSKQYELSVVWFDVAEYMRKVLVSAATMLLPQGSAVQLICSLLLSVVFLLLLVRLTPYKRDADDVLAIVCQARAGAPWQGRQAPSPFTLSTRPSAAGGAARAAARAVAHGGHQGGGVGATARGRPGAAGSGELQLGGLFVGRDSNQHLRHRILPCPQPSACRVELRSRIRPLVLQTTT